VLLAQVGVLQAQQVIQGRKVLWALLERQVHKALRVQLVLLVYKVYQVLPGQQALSV
jgi:hypothetical protein